MEFILIVAALLLTQNYTPVQAAPSVEACPPDSILSEDTCKCNLEFCTKPPCLSVLTLATNGSDLPGSCCPTYSCVDCRNDTLIDGKCPCAPDAVLNDRNQCECVDREKHLVNGKCECNPLQCDLPQLCDRKSVLVTVNDGCCKKTICKPCPTDSESTNLETDVLEDHCVCLPCKNDCGNNKTVIIKKHGTGLPGNCCDLYECKKAEEIKGCQIGGVFYENGADWWTNDQHKCKCQNGLSLCTKTLDEKSQSCIKDHKLYKHLETWTKEDGCTYCTCVNGEEQCISHFCDFKESQIQKNDTQSCSKDGKVYQHLQTWTEKDQCTHCTCYNGEESCTEDFCDKESTNQKNECQPLANCNKTCLSGFKINKKGCEMCKCNSVKIEHILNKYNIADVNHLIKILEEYNHHRTTTTTTTTTTTSTVAPANSADVSTTFRPFVINNNAKLSKDNRSSTTTEPSVVPTDTETESWIYIALPILACIIFITAIAIMCVYKSRRKSSIDLSHCQYETVNTLNNNNTIKKTDQLL